MIHRHRLPLNTYSKQTPNHRQLCANENITHGRWHQVASNLLHILLSTYLRYEFELNASLLKNNCLRMIIFLSHAINFMFCVSRSKPTVSTKPTFFNLFFLPKYLQSNFNEFFPELPFLNHFQHYSKLIFICLSQLCIQNISNLCRFPKKSKLKASIWMKLNFYSENHYQRDC